MTEDNQKRVSVKGDGNFTAGGNLQITQEMKLTVGNEIITMLEVVNLIPEVAKSKLKNGVRKEYDVASKDADYKMNVRFKKHADNLKRTYVELRLLYRGAYEEAKRVTDIDEFDFDEHYHDLRDLSDIALEEARDNPTEALNKLTDMFGQAFAKQDKHVFSRGAIRYYLYEELIRCNVFPNPTTNP